MKFKSIIALTLIIVFSLIFVCCTATSESNMGNSTNDTADGNSGNDGDNGTDGGNANNGDSSSETKGGDDKGEPDWNKGKKEEIIGKIEYSKDSEVILIAKWESRSRVSYHIYGSKKGELIGIVKDNKDEDVFVKISGVVVEGPDPWNKNLLLESIIETYIGTPPEPTE